MDSMETGAIDFVRAVTGDWQQLSKIAMAAKAYWGYPARWLEIWRPVLTLAAEYISWNEVYTAVLDSKIIGFYALVDYGRFAVLDHFWLHPDYIGVGCGRAMFAHAVRHAAAMGCEILEVDSDPNAEGFYLRMGATRIGMRETSLDGNPRLLPILKFDLSCVGGY